jgi:hypothetical protein
VTGGRARRRPAAAGAGGFAPAKLRLGRSNKRLGQLQEVLVEVLGWLVGTEITRKIELATGGNGGHGGSASREEGTTTTFYRRTH